MSLNISSKILSLPGQRVKHVQHDIDQQQITVHCDRDRRYRVIDPVTGKRGRINCYRRRTIRDLPLCGFDCYLDIELVQIHSLSNRRLLEDVAFVDKSNRYIVRFCGLVSGLCRHMSISAVSKHLNLRWETVKNMDKLYLEKTLPALNPRHSIFKTIGGMAPAI